MADNSFWNKIIIKISFYFGGANWVHWYYLRGEMLCREGQIPQRKLPNVWIYKLENLKEKGKTTFVNLKRGGKNSSEFDLTLFPMKNSNYKYKLVFAKRLALETLGSQQIVHIHLTLKCTFHVVDYKSGLVVLFISKYYI